MKVGRFADAARSFEEAVRLSPQSSEREKSLLRKAIQQVSGENTEIEICPGCHAEQPGGRVRCEHCNHYMRGIYLLQEISRHASPAGGVMLVGTMVGAFLPPPVNGLVGVGAIVAGGLLIYNSVKD